MREPVVELAPLPNLIIEPIVRRALEEDLGGSGDVTADACVPVSAQMHAQLRARQPGRMAGMRAAQLAFELIDPSIAFTVSTPCGADFARLDSLAEVRGPARSILSAERVALNLMQRMSGIATLTARYAALVDGEMATIAGTRKTTPGLRPLEKHAIKAGGGGTHRYGLDDAIMIKDNHIAAAGGVGPALMAARAKAGHMVHISVEVDTMEQLQEALRYSPDVVLLDNFPVETLRDAVRTVGGRCTTEASGGVTLETVAEIASTGVDVISVGALTHSAPAIDIGLDIAS